MIALEKSFQNLSEYIKFLLTKKKFEVNKKLIYDYAHSFLERIVNHMRYTGLFSELILEISQVPYVSWIIYPSSGI